MRKYILIFIALFIGILIQTLVFFVPSSIIDGYFFAIKPLLWLIIFCFTYFLFYKTEKIHKDKSSFILITILGVVIYLFAFFISGYFASFGHNPMDTSFRGIFYNFWTFVPIILIKEYVRSKIMVNVNQKNQYLMLTLVAIIFTYLSLDNINNIIKFSLGSKADYLLTTILPLLVINVFLSYTALKGALVSNIAFMLVFLGLPLFSPILPNTPKIFEAIMIYSTIFIMYIVYDKLVFDKKQKEIGRLILKSEKYRWRGFLLPGIILIICLLLGLGAFPFVPHAVASASMVPEFKVGDIVLVEKSTPELLNNLKVGQIIQFRTDRNILVAHRIIEKYENIQGEILFITKGDNNPVQDSMPIRKSQIVGIINVKIPYLGWPAVIFAYLK